jgi:hypothetical protein
MRVLRIALFCLLALAFTACGEQSDKPYLKIAGGGFVFNYRYAAMTYGFVAKPLRPLPEGSELEAGFEVPGSAEVFIVKLPVQAGKMQYVFETQPLKGVVKGKPYKVTLRLLEAGTAKELATLQQTYKSDTDQAQLPTKAPVKGVGYFPNPD